MTQRELLTAESAAPQRTDASSASVRQRTHAPHETALAAKPSGGRHKHPLLLDGWQEFNRQKHGVEVIRIDAGADTDEGASLSAVFYLDGRGRIVRPWRNPYLPVSFHGTPTPYAHRIEHQWHELADVLVGEMRERGVANEIHLPPSIPDIRPWQWAGYNVGVRYTFVIDFPYNPQSMSKQLRSRVRRCERLGYRVERSTDMPTIFSCLDAAATRQNYSLGITLDDLYRANELFGESHLHAYIAYAPNGDAASATVVLHVDGTIAIGWLGGTRTEHLSSGVADLVEVFTYEELRQSGATGIDLCGANIRSIAAYKASLGARLVPYYSVEEYSPRRLAKWVKHWWDFRG